MSKTTRSKIRKSPSTNSFSLDGEKDLFNKIVADQEKFAGPLRPSEVWDLEIGGHNGGQYFQSKQKGENIESYTYSDATYDKKFSSLQKMMGPLVGSTGLQSINRDVVQEYYTYLKGIDHLNILPNYFESSGEMKSEANGLIITDLGSIVDINIISSFLEPVAAKYTILEVGGGYGRLAEVFFNVYGEKRIKYVLVDAVPASLMYSYLYLSKNFPDLRIGFYYNEDLFDMDLFDCYIIPAWHFDASNCSESYDCCVNIQSMQEMNQYHIDYYLSLFNQVLKDGSGIAYISNEKDYIFQGKWNYPSNWKLLFKSRTPRSWTRNSPTEVFLKDTNSSTKENPLIDFIYSLQLTEYDRNLGLQKTISSLQLGLQKSQQQESSMQRELEKRQQEVANLQQGLQKSQQEAANLQQGLQKSQQEVTNLQKGLQKSQQEAANLQSILSRMPLASTELTIEKVEKSLRILYEYYRSQELSDEFLLFESTSKISARLVALNVCLRSGNYKRALVHLVRVGMMDPLVLFSIQTLKIVANGLIYHLRQPQKP